MILLNDEEMRMAEGVVFTETVYGRDDLASKIKHSIAKAAVKKLVDDFTCEECSTPGFVHLVLPRKVLMKELE